MKGEWNKWNKRKMGKRNEEAVAQPQMESQLLYMSMVDNEGDEVQILRTKKKYRIRWLKNGQLNALTRLLMRADKDTERKTSGNEVMDAFMADSKLACKAAAIITLDGFFKLKLRYWFRWRWFYYIRQYDNIQLYPILDMGKKKVPLMQFYVTITSLTEARDTLMRMRKEEVEATLLAQSTEQRSQTGSRDSGS